MRTQSSTATLTQEAQALLLQALPTLERIAGYYAGVYGWTRRLEADDLAQVAALACIEALARGLAISGNPVGYLITIGKYTIRRYCGVYQSLITTPRTRSGYQPSVFVLSLDAPLCAGSDETLLDVLADDYNAVYDAYLDSLPV